jgi:hypothetical protein
VTSETFLMWHYVENADFNNMAMTRTGIVVFGRDWTVDTGAPGSTGYEQATAVRV